MNTTISLGLIKNWQQLIQEVDFTDLAASLIQKKIITVDEYQSIVLQTGTKAMENFLVLLLKKNEEVLLKFAEILKKDYSWVANNLMEGYIKEEGQDETDASPITRLDVDHEIDTDNFTQNRNNSSDSCDQFQDLNSMNRSDRLRNTFNNKRPDLGRRKIIKSRLKNKFKPKVLNSESFISSTTDLIKQSLNEEVTDEVISILRRSPLISKSWTTLAHALGLTDRVHEIRYKVVIHGEDLSMCVVYLIKDWLELLPEIATLSKLIEVLRSEGFNSVSDKLTDILYGKKRNLSSAIQ